jgi:hypothetical protein
MANSKPRVRRATLRKETREWLTKKTIPNVREIARDLEDAGEDVTDLFEAIDELEALLREGPRRAPPKATSTAEA